VNASANWIGGAWGDFNNDGFPDLFVGNQNGINALYVNDTNTNNWLMVQCLGRVSNRAAIGAKVRIRATVAGKTMWQMREISGGGGLACQNELRAQFGLGDATKADVVRIEWPSGAVQELTNVAAKQFLTAREPSRLKADFQAEPGEFHVALSGAGGTTYLLEGSTNLVNWMALAWLTNQSGSLVWTNPASSPAMYFRASE